MPSSSSSRIQSAGSFLCQAQNKPVLCVRWPMASPIIELSACPNRSRTVSHPWARATHTACPAPHVRWLLDRSQTGTQSSNGHTRPAHSGASSHVSGKPRRRSAIVRCWDRCETGTGCWMRGWLGVTVVAVAMQKDRGGRGAGGGGGAADGRDSERVTYRGRRGRKLSRRRRLFIFGRTIR